MDVFSHYDIYDYNGNKMAEGHKASFCLEDVVCHEGNRTKYSCDGEQGNLSALVSPAHENTR